MDPEELMNLWLAKSAAARNQAADPDAAPPPWPIQPLTGLYSLGQAALSGGDGSTLDWSSSDGSLPTASDGSNPYVQLTAYHPVRPPAGPLATYGRDIPPPLPDTPTGYGAGPPPAPKPQPNDPQDNARRTLQVLGRPVQANSTDPTVDALENTAQGRAVAPGETPPDFSARQPWETSDQYRQRKMREEDLQALRDPPVKAYLDTMAFSEAFGYGAPLDYSSLYGDHPLGRRQTFSDFSGFPSGKGAVGRYQFTKTTYQDFQKRMGVSDVLPLTQDLMGVQLMREHGVLDRLLSDDFAGAVNNSSPWASTPQLVNGQWVKRPKGTRRATPFDQLQQYYQGRLNAYTSRR